MTFDDKGFEACLIILLLMKNYKTFDHFDRWK